MIIIVFGFPGAGKTYVGKILASHFGFYLHDGDTDLPEEMRLTLAQHGKISDDMRDVFFHSILNHLESLEENHQDIIVTQTFIKEKYREWVREKFPKTKFLLIFAPDAIREKRLKKRTEYPLDIAYSRQMVRLFEKPHIPYFQIDNSVDGEEHILLQLSKIFTRENQ